MSTQATAGPGTRLRRWNAGVWNDVAEIKNINGPNKTKGTIDVTSLSSDSGYREFIGGFIDPGTVSMAMIFRRDTYDIMNTDFESSGLKNYEIVLPDSDVTSFEFLAEVTELGLAITVDDAIMSDVTLKVSGELTVNSGSGSD